MNTLQLRQDERRSISCLGVLAALGLFYGIGGSVYSRFLSGANALPALISGVLILLILPLLKRTRHGGWIAFFALCAAFAAGIAFFDLAGGLCAVLDRFLDSVGAKTAYIMPRVSSSEAAVPIALCFLSALLALGCLWIARERARAIGWLIALVLFLPDVLIGTVTSNACIFALVAGLILMRLPSRGKLIAGICVAAALALAATLAQPAATLNRAHDAVSDWIWIQRFGESGALPRGDFSRLAQKTSAPMLEITMDRAESLYLRGYVGSEYDGSAFKPAAPESLWDGEELFYWLHRDGFYGETQLAALNAALGETSPIQITVRHLGEPRDVVFVPYELISLEKGMDARDIGDIRPRTPSVSGFGEYSLIANENLVKKYVSLSRELAAAEKNADEVLNAYLIDESHYNRFVYAHFLSVPDETRALIQGLIGNFAFESGAHMDYAQAKALVLEWLNGNVEYAEGGSLRADTDFIADFLTQSKSGGDAHYAAATALMMRCLGIPARYVEGYLIAPDAEVRSGEPFVLTGTNAHAWAEIYQDGVGWVPFETAPEYLNLMENEDLLTGSGAGESPNANEPIEDPPIENSLDMTEDFHEDPDEADNSPADELVPIFRKVLAAGLILALLIAIALLILRRIERAQRERQFRLANRKLAVQNLYAELFESMKRIYGAKNRVSPADFDGSILESMGADMRAKYDRALEICRRAAYSDQGVSEEEYRFVYAFVQKSRIQAKRTKKRKK